MQFSQLIGNSSAIERIRQMVDNNHLPHALLLHGETGVPKLALARTLAQYLHCTNRTGGEPCGTCPACRQHQSLNHTDTFFSFPYVKPDSKKEWVCDDFLPQWREFLEKNPLVEDYQQWLETLKVDNKQGTIYVDESAAIMRKMSLSSFTAQYKVLIMWLPEKMEEASANKLLKLIEEPFDDCRFVLVSDNAKAILPTIFSRTQRIELRKPSTDEVAAYLSARHNLDPQDAVALAAPADGNVVMAEQSLNADSENHQFHQRFMELMRLAYARDLVKLKAWAGDIADYKREKACRFLQYAERQVRENFIYNLRQPSLNYLTREEQQFSTRFSPYINENNVERMEQEFNRARIDIAGNAYAKLVLFDLAVTITILIKV